MTKLSSLGARRIRTLLSVGENIELRPITILLGRNSVGKSTYARLFPLLRQSAERKKRAPILWFDDLVDFGGFDQAVTRGYDSIEFLFNFTDLSNETNTTNHPYWLYPDGPCRIKLPKVNIGLTLLKSQSQSQGECFAKEISISFEGITYKLISNSNNDLEHILVNGSPVAWDKSKYQIHLEQKSILPSLIFLQKMKSEQTYWKVVPNFWQESVSELINTNTKIIKQQAQKIAASLPLSDVKTISSAAQNIPGTHIWEHIKKTITPNSSLTQNILRELGLAHLHTLLSVIDDSLRTSFKGVRYLKPLRATAERYYRRADLSVSEIDPEGKNLPIFLDSLSEWQLNDFRTWLQHSLDIDIKPVRHDAQIKLMAKGHNDVGFSNVADMGFGISQILPIAAQLWASSSIYMPRDLDRNSHTIVMEQPELHLHPAFQAKLADVFANTIKNQNNKLKNNSSTLIIETHSQQLINRLGQLVEERQLKPSDISIILFEADESAPGTSTVRSTTFDENGVLKNWPFGFFDPVY